VMCFGPTLPHMGLLCKLDLYGPTKKNWIFPQSGFLWANRIQVSTLAHHILTKINQIRSFQAGDELPKFLLIFKLDIWILSLAIDRHLTLINN